MNIGNVITSGNYQWTVLDIKEDKMLIITDLIIEQRDYHDRKAPVTWEQSEIRHYLNNRFLERLGSSDQDKILTTHNINTDNPWYGSFGGADTFDRVFLLSLDECVRLYFGDSSRLLDNPKLNQRYWFDRKDQNNIKGLPKYKTGKKEKKK